MDDAAAFFDMLSAPASRTSSPPAEPKPRQILAPSLQDVGTDDPIESYIFEQPKKERRVVAAARDIVTDAFHARFARSLHLFHEEFGDAAFQSGACETAFVRAARVAGHRATLAPPGNPGWDVDLNHLLTSLKTQADKGIKEDQLHISKLMELGAADVAWGSDKDNLPGLRDAVLAAISGYDRTLVFRRLGMAVTALHVEYHYELLEIPKAVLVRMRDYLPVFGKNTKVQDSDSEKDRSATLTVPDAFTVSFGGGERKVTLDVERHQCLHHADWTVRVPLDSLVR